MTHARLVLSTLMVTMLVGSLPAREWSDSSGQFHLEAEFVSVRSDKVYLEKSDGQVVTVPLGRLSEKDLRHLASLPEGRRYFEAHPMDGVELPEPASPAKAKAEASAKPGPAAEEPAAEPGEFCRFSDLRWGVESLAFSPDGRLLAAGKMDRTVLVFDVEKKRQVAMAEKLEGLGQVTAVAFSPDGKLLLTGGYTGRIQLWDISPEGAIAEAHRFVGHSGAVRSITVSKDGSSVLSGGDDKKACCWTLADGHERFAIDGFAGPVKATFITRGGKQGLACDGDVIALVDMAEGKAIQSMKLDKRSAQAVAIAPDGSLVVAQDMYALDAWEIKSGAGRPLFQDREIQWSAVFSADSRYLISGGRGKVNLWRADECRKVYEFDTDAISYVKTLACSPNGRLFAAASGSAGRDIHVFRLPAE